MQSKTKVSGTSQPLQQQSILFAQGVSNDRKVKLAAEKGTNGVPFIRQHVTGSLDHFSHISVPGLSNEVVMLIGDEDQALSFNIPQVIVNCIADGDNSTQALTKLQKLIDQIRAVYKIDIPVINPPAGIALTTRDKIYEQFKDLPGLTFPRVVRIKPQSVAEAEKQVKDAGIATPFIIRDTGTHGGENMQQIADWSPQEKLKLERYAYDGREYYVIEWVDFKSKDGLYRKSRLVCVNGTFIPRHQITSNEWNVHARSRQILMKEREELRQQEETFLSTPIEKSVSPAAMNSLRRMHDLLGLDYFGIDCSIRDDGSLLIFEVNAACNAMVQQSLATYPYLARNVQRIIKAFNDLVALKAAPARAA